MLLQGPEFYLTCKGILKVFECSLTGRSIEKNGWIHFERTDERVNVNTFRNLLRQGWEELVRAGGSQAVRRSGRKAVRREGGQASTQGGR